MRIALDLDGTFTEDPKFWADVCKLAADYGHRVVVVTSRRDTADNREDVERILGQVQASLPVVFTSMAAKQDFVNRHGINVDVWIDDEPRAIVEGK